MTGCIVAAPDTQRVRPDGSELSQVMPFDSLAALSNREAV